MAKFCVSCGAQMDDNQQFCPSCGAAQNAQQAPVQPAAPQPTVAQPSTGGKSKMAAGLLGIFFGGIGIHNFYLGFTGKAIAQIVVTFITCGAGSIWGFIEGILILTGSINKDADGRPLVN